MQFAYGAVWAFPIGRGDLGYRHAQLQRMHGEFGFDLESLGKGGKGTNEPLREYTISGENILEVLAEDAGNHPREHVVAEAMTTRKAARATPVRAATTISSWRRMSVSTIVGALAAS